ncbi:hydrogenase nickel incorporation protein HypB [Edaphobacter modestus]|uniref:Hydrogenase nickel incorporation protein HypB n=1 Tax=Edaphobacter modestus TaxID=388466 RepID=A0A4Q7YNK8_9BACT|nr:hydrogenase nickel incorporation protein HypB [Edaphobacter modestus]RZU38928.1 hydrogenase nickel incorporation protein HypB [Edaphobacter modestus]
MSTRIVEVRAKVMKQNDLLAHSLRERFTASGVFVVGLVSSPGSGKTAFLEKLLGGLAADFRIAALVGDLATENDAARLKRATPNVRQITTGTICHLDARMIEKALDGWQLDALDFLFIENVGNLVCPSSYDLGEGLRFVLLSATEGEDKPLKYPTIFNSSDVAIITKMDMAALAEFDVAAARRNIETVRPGMLIFEVSAKTGSGMQDVLKLLRDRLVDSQEPSLAPQNPRSVESAI